jgi:hypothetical protein
MNEENNNGAENKPPMSVYMRLPFAVFNFAVYGSAVVVFCIIFLLSENSNHTDRRVLLSVGIFLFLIRTVVAAARLRLVLALRKRGGEPNELEIWRSNIIETIDVIALYATMAFLPITAYIISNNNVLFFLALAALIIALIKISLLAWRLRLILTSKPVDGGERDE